MPPSQAPYLPWFRTTDAAAFFTSWRIGDCVVCTSGHGGSVPAKAHADNSIRERLRSLKIKHTIPDGSGQITHHHHRVRH
ncbi:MAG: hypothetical protein ACXVGN_12370 [Mycobacteriaceae bacterium]